MKWLGRLAKLGSDILGFFKKSPEQKERDRIAKNVKQSKTNIKDIADAIDEAKAGNSRRLESILGL